MNFLKEVVVVVCKRSAPSLLPKCNIIFIFLMVDIKYITAGKSSGEDGMIKVKYVYAHQNISSRRSLFMLHTITVVTYLTTHFNPRYNNTFYTIVFFTLECMLVPL